MLPNGSFMKICSDCGPHHTLGRPVVDAEAFQLLLRLLDVGHRQGHVRQRGSWPGPLANFDWPATRPSGGSGAMPPTSIQYPSMRRNVRTAGIVIETEHVAVELAGLGDLFRRGPDADTVVMQLQHFHGHEKPPVRRVPRCPSEATRDQAVAGRGAERWAFGTNRENRIGAPAAHVNRARLPRVPQVGSPLPRPDDPRLLTGRGRYVDDHRAAPHGSRRLRPQRARPRPDRSARPRRRSPRARAWSAVLTGEDARGSASRAAACCCTTRA